MALGFIVFRVVPLSNRIPPALRTLLASSTLISSANPSPSPYNPVHANRVLEFGSSSILGLPLLVESSLLSSSSLEGEGAAVEMVCIPKPKRESMAIATELRPAMANMLPPLNFVGSDRCCAVHTDKIAMNISDAVIIAFMLRVYGVWRTAKAMVL
mmetsp:Transcript_27731/g.43634  ORF Transcript_27731/g.43634 Transcript_27731/m.43634 type:complete len:156 (+) Transcript_27731:528-995(+)